MISLSRFFPFCCCLLFIAMGIVGITAGYSVYNHTYDEQAHLAAGMELLDLHRYEYETLHPPLARMMIALLPYLEGLSPPKEAYDSYDMWEMGNLILYKNNNYFHNLTLARLGILPFYILSVLTVFAWGRRFYDTPTAISAALLFSTTPSILANSMVATTDMAMVATFSLAILVMLTWLERPSLGRSAAVGLATGLAMLAKTSAIIFLPLSYQAIILYRAYRFPPAPSSLSRQQRMLQWGAMLLCFALTIWCGHFFINFPSYLGFERFFAELQSLLMKNEQNHYEFFMGGTSDTPIYYPVIFFVKTPLAFTFLIALGMVVWWKTRKTSPWQHAIPLMLTVMILFFAMISHIHIGLRHILSIYPFLALIAGYGIAHTWQNSRHVIIKPLLLLLIGGHLASTAASYPYYLGYFNELVKKPEETTVHSDLGWGGELYLLTQELKRRNIQLDYLYYAGLAKPEYFGLPTNLCNWNPGIKQTPKEAQSGWYAISQGCLKVSNAKELAWLHNYTPVAKIGSSIFLYHID